MNFETQSFVMGILVGMVAMIFIGILLSSIDPPDPPMSI